MAPERAFPQSLFDEDEDLGIEDDLFLARRLQEIADSIVVSPPPPGPPSATGGVNQSSGLIQFDGAFDARRGETTVIRLVQL